MPPKVDLIVPGLFDLPLAEFEPGFLRDELPALNRVLRFARRAQTECLELEALVADAFGQQQLKCLPFAQAYGQDSTPGTRLVLCRAVHLKADMLNAIVLPLQQGADTETDIARILQDLESMFEEDFSIKDLGDGLWIMQLHSIDAPEHYPHYLAVLGKKANPYIEQSKTMLPWYRLMNEIQMFMHAHQVNQKRIADGLLAINSLWCWGAGKSAFRAGSEANWYCDDGLLQHFVKSLGLSCKPLAAITHELFDKPAVCVDLQLLEALKSASGRELKPLLVALETGLFQPLQAPLQNGKIVLRLRAGTQHELSLSRLSRFKFWMPDQSLVELSDQ